jgi:type III secretory pathway component EscR
MSEEAAVENVPTPEQWKKTMDEISCLKNQVEQYRQQLKRYTNTDRHKKYYQQNKEKVKKNAKEYLNRLKVENPEKLKEYRHNAYVKRRDRLNQEG